jgi:hypothetical protein
MRGRVEHILAIPWGLHFDALELDSGRMERKYFVCLFNRELELIRGRKSAPTLGLIAKRKWS